MATSYLQFLLHAHLPFIRHPEYEDFLEERWLYEAVSETYLPLLAMLDRLSRDGIAAPLAISFSPSLMAMLEDDLLRSRYVTYLERQIDLGLKEVERTRQDPDTQAVARLYLERAQENHHAFVEVYKGEILAAYGKFARRGLLEIMTTPATYPFLPFYQHQPQAIRSQIETALDYFDSIFGFRPSGLWLPEAGYFEGLEEFLGKAGIRYFFVSFHGMMFSPEVPRAGIYAPIRLPNGTHAFGRDLSSAALVWSQKDGYPGDPVYRDFYRDIGYDLPLDYIGPHIHLGKVRIPTGYKYHAITGQGDEKLIYRPLEARKKIREHARNYVYHHVSHMEKVQPLMDQAPVSTNPFSAELLGHWWYEGIDWLEEVFRELENHRGELEAISPSAYLARYPDNQPGQAIFSSWGNKGYAETWLDGSSDWIYRHIHMGIDRMTELTDRFPDATGLKKRALNQAAREILLCQTLDWPVIMRSGVAADYAKGRIKEHLSNFYRIYDALGEGRLGTEWLTRIEKKNNCFPHIDYLLFQTAAPRPRNPKVSY